MVVLESFLGLFWRTFGTGVSMGSIGCFGMEVIVGETFMSTRNILKTEISLKKLTGFYFTSIARLRFRP